MPIKEFPAFLRKHKTVRVAVIFSVISCVLLLVQLILMKKNPLNVVFNVIIPITAAFTFGCYAITMAMDRPMILSCPPTVYFVSLLVNQLISVEVGVEQTYPIFTFIELVPYILFCISVSADKIKKITTVVLKIWCGLIAVTSAALSVLSIFFRITLYTSETHAIVQTFGLISGLFAVFFIYMGMIELLKISGCDKRIRPTKKMKSKKSSAD